MIWLTITLVGGREVRRGYSRSLYRQAIAYARSARRWGMPVRIQRGAAPFYEGSTP